MQPVHGQTMLATMMLSAMASAAAPSAITATASSRPWTAGWGFAATGGIPPQPPHMRSYAINRTVLATFVANNTGLANGAELAAEVKSGVVGIGWNLYHSKTGLDPQKPAGPLGGGIEAYETQQAAALKKLRPDVGVMVLRNTEVVSVFWTAAKKAMQNPALWLQCPPGSGKPCAELWGTDDPKSGPPTLKYFLNFSNPDTQTWWLNEYITPALSQPNIDGVYTDCSCGNAKGEKFTSAEAVGRQKAFDAARALAAAKGKWFTTWANTGPPPLTSKNCAAVMQQAVAAGKNASQTLQWHAGELRNSGQIPLENLAGFLLARGASAMMYLEPYDRPMLARPWSLPGVAEDADPGTPTGPATLAGGVWKRSFSAAEVTLDCAAFKGAPSPSSS